MSLNSQNIEIYAGDDKLLSYTIYDNDNDNNILNLTGLLRAQWVVKKNPKQSNPILTKILGSGITISLPTSGIIDVVLNETDTQEINPGNYYHELRIETAGSKVGTVANGFLTILPTEEMI